MTILFSVGVAGFGALGQAAPHLVALMRYGAAVFVQAYAFMTVIGVRLMVNAG